MSDDISARVTAGVRGLHPYVPGKPVEELERELGISHTIKLASNENPLGPSPKGLAAAREAIAGINLYPDDTAFRLRNKLSALNDCRPGQLIIGSGSSDVIEMTARTFLQPGCNAVYSAHSFAMYAIYTQAVGASAKVAPALPADHPEMPYGHDLDAMAGLIDADTRVVFIANPNNPTGTWLTREQLTRFLERVPRDVVVLLDEAYTEYVELDDFPNGMALLKRYPNLLVTRTFSKIYGLAGLRVGYGVAASDALAGWINRLRAPFNVNLPALAAAEAALDDDEFIARSVRNNRNGLQQLAEGFAQLGLSCMPSVGNFICVDTGVEAAPLFDALLHEGVIVRPVANYGLPTHLRISVGRGDENARCLAALARVLGK